jgi:N utilization substance protein B
MTKIESPGEKMPTPVGQGRSVARLAAVQALYQMEFSGADPLDVIKEFIAHRIGREIEGDAYAEADQEHFKWLVLNTVSRIEELDAWVSSALNAKWTIKRLGALMQAVLRAACAELVARPDIPARVVMNEYVELAGAFFSQREPAFVNAALDTLARRLRVEEFPPSDTSSVDVETDNAADDAVTENVVDDVETDNAVDDAVTDNAGDDVGTSAGH